MTNEDISSSPEREGILAFIKQEEPTTKKEIIRHMQKINNKTGYDYSEKLEKTLKVMETRSEIWSSLIEGIPHYYINDEDNPKPRKEKPKTTNEALTEAEKIKLFIKNNPENSVDGFAKVAEEATGVSRGNVYAIISNLKKKGEISMVEAEDRFVYALSETLEQEAQPERELMSKPINEFRSPDEFSKPRKKRKYTKREKRTGLEELLIFQYPDLFKREIKEFKQSRFIEIIDECISEAETARELILLKIIKGLKNG